MRAETSAIRILRMLRRRGQRRMTPIPPISASKVVLELEVKTISEAQRIPIDAKIRARPDFHSRKKRGIVTAAKEPAISEWENMPCDRILPSRIRGDTGMPPSTLKGLNRE